MLSGALGSYILQVHYNKANLYAIGQESAAGRDRLGVNLRLTDSITLIQEDTPQ